MFLTLASTCLKISRNLGTTFQPSPVHLLCLPPGGGRRLQRKRESAEGYYFFLHPSSSSPSRHHSTFAEMEPRRREDKYRQVQTDMISCRRSFMRESAAILLPWYVMENLWKESISSIIHFVPLYSCMKKRRGDMIGPYCDGNKK